MDQDHLEQVLSPLRQTLPSPRAKPACCLPFSLHHRPPGEPPRKAPAQESSPLREPRPRRAHARKAPPRKSPAPGGPTHGNPAPGEPRPGEHPRKVPPQESCPLREPRPWRAHPRKAPPQDRLAPGEPPQPRRAPPQESPHHPTPLPPPSTPAPEEVLFPYPKVGLENSGQWGARGSVRGALGGSHIS